jgi:hypothetical protein
MQERKEELLIRTVHGIEDQRTAGEVLGRASTAICPPAEVALARDWFRGELEDSRVTLAEGVNRDS